MAQQVIPFADQTGARTIPFGATADEWAAMRISVTNAATGTVIATQRFDAWGNRIAGTGTVPLYGYAGREPDITGLIHMRARAYDPSIGRFTQADPLGFVDGVNQYAYARNNSINRSDPLGTLSQPSVGTRSSYGGSGPGTVRSGQQSLGPASSLSRGLDQFQAILDLAGLFAQGPLEVAGLPIDLANAGISALRGNYGDASLSVSAAIPFVGVAANVTKGAKGAGTSADALADAARRAPAPNNGIARPHGDAAHNRAIDDRVRELQADQTVSNIRKNQQQVDVNGNRVGTNRPDLQYDQCGVHHCVEYDTIPRNSTRHGNVIRADDPNATVDLNLL